MFNSLARHRQNHLTLCWLITALLGLSTGTACRLEPTSSVSDLALSIHQEIEPERLRRQAEAIVQHQRPSGSEGENAAIDHIVETLESEGIQVDVHTFSAYASDPVEARIEVVGENLDLEAITFSFSASNDNLEAELVDLGVSASLPDFETGTGERLELVRGTGPRPNLQGMIALVEGRPSNFTTYKLALMEAAGVIFVNPQDRLNDLIVTTTWGSPSLRNAHRIPQLPVGQIKKSDGEAIRRLLGTGSVHVRLHTQVETGWRPLRLAVARIPAPDPAAPYVLLGGHIDAWYHGGTDEGASNAAMLELARSFHRHRDALRRGLVVAWWPGHSNARYAGSTWFADHYFDELRTRAVAYLNIDGIGQMGAKRFSATATASLSTLAQDVIGTATEDDIRVGRPGRNSDQSFNGVGLPLLQINHTRLAEDGGYWWWHTPADTLDKIDFQVLETDTELYAKALATLLAAPTLPLGLAAQVETLGEALSRRHQSAGSTQSWFEEALIRQRELLTIASRIEETLSRQPGTDTDLALIGILRPLHRVLYVPFNNYHPDSGADSSPLPGLAPAEILGSVEPDQDRYGFAVPVVRRELNRLLEALDDALERANRLESRLAG